VPGYEVVVSEDHGEEEISANLQVTGGTVEVESSVNGDGRRKGVQTRERQIYGQDGRGVRKHRKTAKVVNKPALFSSSFKRGGEDVWVSRGHVLTSHQVPFMVGDLIASISMTSVKALEEGGHAIIQTLMDLVMGEEWAEKVTAFQVDSLHSIASRCKRAEDMSTNTEFVAMLNMLQLTSKLERYLVII
jgi:hypothetical protein